MGPKQLAEVYEELKELRRQGESEGMIKSRIEHLSIQGSIAPLVKEQSAALSRFLEIKTLADRVFGDERKSEAWLQRPRATLSGQRPIDLLKDELGAAVVREILEQVDHGIFA